MVRTRVNAASLVVFVGLAALGVVASYGRRPHRRWNIRWGNLLFAALSAVVGAQSLTTGQISTSRHSVTLLGAPAFLVGVLLLGTSALALAVSFSRRTPSDND